LPDPGVTQTGLVKVSGFVLDPGTVSRTEFYVDDQFKYRANTGRPRIDVLEAFPDYPGIFNMTPGFQTGFLASRFSNGPHTVYVRVTLSDGTIQELGRRTITIDNTLNQSPFGSLDQPGGGGNDGPAGSLFLLFAANQLHAHACRLP